MFLPQTQDCSYPRRMDLVSWIFGNDEYDHNRKIYIDPDHPGRCLSANEARCMVRKLVAGFKANGLQPGDCVCVHAFNDIMYTMLFLGIIGAGGLFTGSNPAYTSTELSHHMSITGARFLISEPELLHKIAPAIDECSLPVSNVFVFDPTGRDFPLYYRSWKTLLDCGERDWVRFEDDDEARSTTAALLSTSGTTGLPKAAMISHHNCIVQNMMINDSSSKTYEVSRIVTLPEFHAFAFPLAHVAPLREGIPTYIMRRFDLQRYFSTIQQYGITETPMVPQIMRKIVEQPSLARGMLKSLQLVWSAGAPLPESLHDQFYRLLKPAARVIQVWGMTEAGWISTFLWPEKDHSGSVGRLLPGMEAKLVNDNGDEIETDEISAEIFVRGPSIMQGYRGNVAASKDTIDDEGWLRTGDVAYKNQGRLYIVDRKKEMLKVRGWQVSPAELEAALLLHPDITDAAVVGAHLKQGDDTELPRAYIVKLGNSNLSPHEVKRFMLSRVAKYKSLDGGVVFVDAIPRNSAGKVQRSILRDRAAAEICEVRAMDCLPLPASALPNRKRSPEGSRISSDCSVLSYDGANESGRTSRRSSNSTVGTVYSEIIGWPPKTIRIPVPTKEVSNYPGKASSDQESCDSSSESNSADDDKFHIGQHVMTERGKRGSGAIARPSVLVSPHYEHMDRENVQVSVDPPTSNDKVSSNPSDSLASALHQSPRRPPPLSDIKKRNPDYIEESTSLSSSKNSKKAKTNITFDNNHHHQQLPQEIDDRYRQAMSIVLRNRSFRLD